MSQIKNKISEILAEADVPSKKEALIDTLVSYTASAKSEKALLLLVAAIAMYGSGDSEKTNIAVRRLIQLSLKNK